MNVWNTESFCLKVIVCYVYPVWFVYSLRRVFEWIWFFQMEWHKTGCGAINGSDKFHSDWQIHTNHSISLWNIFNLCLAIIVWHVDSWARIQRIERKLKCHFSLLRSFFSKICLSVLELFFVKHFISQVISSLDHFINSINFSILLPCLTFDWAIVNFFLSFDWATIPPLEIDFYTVHFILDQRKSDSIDCVPKFQLRSRTKCRYVIEILSKISSSLDSISANILFLISIVHHSTPPESTWDEVDMNWME